MTDLAISTLQAQQYKNLSSECSINFDRLTVLIGPNASGKTNLIHLLEFLHDAISESSQSDRGTTMFDRSILRMGGDHILDRRLEPPNNVRMKMFFPTREKGQKNVLDLELRIQGNNRKVIINKEFLYQQTPDRPDFYFYKCHDQRSGAGVVSVYRENEPSKSRFYALENVPTDELSLVAIQRLLENSQFPPEKTPVFEVRRKLLDSISSWRFYNANDMNLEAIRLSEPKIGASDIYLSSSAENLPLVLENLTQSNIDFEDRLNQVMQEVLPWTHRIRSVRSGRLSLVTEWHMAPPGQPREQFYLSDMSDGSVRMLCWACILLSPQLPNLLVIEEPEIGIHVAWMRILAEWITQASTQTQVIVSTHSPDLLDHFTENLENVIVMQLSKDEPNRFCMNNLRRGSLESQLKEGWQLGDLYRVGDPGIGGWPW